MDLYKRLKRTPKQFLAFTGMHLHTFEDLLPEFEQAFLKLEQRRKGKTVRSQADRQRRPGGGNTFQNDLPNRLLMLLLYYRLYLTQEFLTLFFNAANKSLISRNITLMREVFEAVLPTPQRARERILSLAKAEQQRRQKRISSIEEFREAYPELTFIIDGVEQPKRRPKDKQKRKDDYSGKKKRHTRKQLLTSTPNGIIVDQSPQSVVERTTFKPSKTTTSSAASSTSFKECGRPSMATAAFKGCRRWACPPRCACKSADGAIIR